MSKKFRLLMGLVMVMGLLGGLLTSSTVSADPDDGTVIEIPRIDNGDAYADEGDWDTTIQVQNLGEAGGAVVFFWEAYSADCPSNAPGPSGHACMQLPAGGVWTLHNQIPDDAFSAIVYSVSATTFQVACDNAANVEGSTAEWKTWVGDYAGTGPDLAVTVDRWGTDPFGEVELSASYTGVVDPDMAGTEVFAPYVMHAYNNLDTVITIQNSGDMCTSVWIHYKMQGNCEFYKAQHIELLAPGESITVGPAGFDFDFEFPGTGVYEPGAGNWLGSAYISANEPLAVIVDQLSLTGENRGTMLSMRGMPYDQTEEHEWYADLLYREWSGYSSSIQVQNITDGSLPTWVTVEFFDQSGDQIFYVGEWVCRNGSATFYLPAITDLGVNYGYAYVGAAEIVSHAQVDYPGEDHAGEPIFVVVDIKKTKVYDESLPGWRHTIAGETQGGAYNAHPEHQKVNMWGWAMPYVAKEQEGVTSRIVVRNNSNCTKIKGNLYIRDETGRDVAWISVPWLHPKHMSVQDLAYFGSIPRGFVGAAVYMVEQVEQLCDTDFDGEADIEPVMPSVVVLNYGYEKELPVGGGAGPQTTEGDLTRVYEAIPFDYMYSPCVVTVSGNVIDEVTTDPIDGADVNEGADTTDSTGYFEFDVDSNMGGEPFTLKVTKSGYADWESAAMTLLCDDVVINPEMDPDCEDVSLTVYIEDKETGDPIVLDDLEDLTATTSAGAGVVASTAVAGEYEVTDIEWDPDSPVIVSVAVEGYNVSIDTVYIPVCGGSGTLTFQLHQTPMSRILLYYGNDGDNEGYTDAEALFKYLGFIVDYDDDWPTDPDLEEYKVIFLLGPGNDVADEDPTQYFTPGQIAQLDLFMRNGGRLVIMSDAGEQADVENDLIDALNDFDVQFVDSSTVTGALADDLDPDDQLLGGATPDVNTLDFNTAMSITVETDADPGYIARVDAPHPQDGATICAADTMPGITRLATADFAGDVVLIGDMDWMDDASFMGTITWNASDPTDPDYVWPDWPADNENLLLNIIGF